MTELYNRYMQKTKEDPKEELRLRLVDYLAVSYGGKAARLADDLGYSHTLLSRYLRGLRAISGPFCMRIKQHIPELTDACDDALREIGTQKWQKEGDDGS
mgnify:CR=1 FL=1|jgi:hypothetical protein